MLSEELRAQGRIEHDGGPCPVARRRNVTVLFRDGVEGYGIASLWIGRRHNQWLFNRHYHADNQIIAYKLETPDA